MRSGKVHISNARDENLMPGLPVDLEQMIAFIREVVY